MDFGSTLRQFRTSKGITQEKLAEKLSSLSPGNLFTGSSFLSRLENGKRAPKNREIVLLLAKSLGLDAEETSHLVIAAGYIPQAPGNALETDARVHQCFFRLADIIDNNIAFRQGHSARVSVVVRSIAEAMKLADSRIRPLEIAARVHDIGYIGVSSTILARGGSRTLSEMAEIQSHPTVAVHLLQGLKSFQEALPIIHYHHEYYDGNGYPSRLSGDRIPVEARILSIADAYDAMTSRRRHRAPLPDKEILRIFQQGKGRQWDPGIAAKFLEMLKEYPLAPAGGW